MLDQQILYLKLNCIDLNPSTRLNLADYIYGLEVANAGAGVAWFNTHFPNYPLDYNVGTLTHVEGLVSHDMIGFNQWDEVMPTTNIALVVLILI